MTIVSFRNIFILLGVTGLYWMWKVKSAILQIGEKSDSAAIVFYHVVIGCIFGYVMMLIYLKFKYTKVKYTQDLHSLEERYRMIFDNFPLGIVYFDQQIQRITACNAKSMEVLGVSKEKCMGLQVEDIKDENLKSAILSALSGETTCFEGNYTSFTGGKELFLKAQLQPIKSSEGKCLGVVGTIEDITERKRVETAILESEAKFKLYVDKCPDGIFIANSDGKYIDVNPAGCLMLGYDKKDLLQKTIKDISSPDSFKNLEELKPTDERVTTEGTLIRKNGSLITVDLKAVTIGNNLNISYVRDLTERKKADERIAELATLVESSNDAIISGTLDGTICYWNNSAEGIFGYLTEEVIGKHYSIVVPEEKLPEFEEQLRSILKGKKNTHFETVRLKKGGIYINVSLTASPVMGLDGNVKGFSVIARDISERKKIERSLKKSEEQYRMIFDNSPFGIIHFDQTGVITHSNDNFIEMLGTTRDKIIGFNMLTQLRDANMLKTIQTALTGKVGYYEGSYTSVTSGKTFPIKAVFNRISEDGTFIGGIGIFEDITEKVEIQREMARLDRLNLVGQMSAGIGHEIRNPMTSVKGFLQLLANKETDAKNIEYYEIMIGELDRANTIITEFLSLARNRVVELHPASLNIIINALYPLLSSDAIGQDKCIMLNKGDVPNLPLNAKEIRQLIVNLVRNAIEASPVMGVVTLSTYVSDSEVVLSVKDEGTGITPEILDKIGTPFVTTKEHGTGLGLSVCYSIADKHNAKIDIKTGSSGTTFFVRFKLSQIQIEEQVS